jgi:hypothetical protein
MPYIPPPTTTDNHHTFKRRIYATLLQLTIKKNRDCEMRISRKYPAVDWKRIWRNLHTSGLSSSIKSTCYATINDIIPTHDRLADIHLVTTNARPRCNNPDSVIRSQIAVKVRYSGHGRSRKLTSSSEWIQNIFPKSGRKTQPSIYGPHNDRQQYCGF